MERTEKTLYLLMMSLITIMIVTALAIDGPVQTLRGFLLLQIHAARLINDFTVTGVGAAMFNSALVGLIGLSLVYFSSVSLSGPTLAALLTVIGFGFFGKTVLNIIPIIAGVKLAARIAHKTLGSYSIIALFGTALGPLVTYTMFGLGLPLALSIPLALLAGVGAGFILPGISGSMLGLHQGYSLYNVGFSCGFLGLFASSLFQASNSLQPLSLVWNTESNLALILFIPLLSVASILLGLYLDDFKLFKKTFPDFLQIQKIPGRLPSDFFDTGYSGGTLLNVGLLGIASFSYVLLVKAPLNGPVLGAILTAMGFGAFGKNFRNSLPVIAGVIIATLVFSKNLNDPGPILAALFCTTLAPIAGQFGIIAGLMAGFLHLVMVETTAAWHGGLDLYNNGFAGGLTASLIMAVLQWYKTNRPMEDFES